MARKRSQKKKLFLFRELGVLKPYRREVTPYLCFPLFQQASINNYDVALLSTNLSSQVFKWGLGIGLFPLHFFMIDKLILMGGSVKYAAGVFEELIRGNLNKTSYGDVTENINRYLCKRNLTRNLKKHARI